MAYAFNNIMGALGLTDNNDIFNGEGNEVGNGGPQGPSAGLQSSSEGDLSGGGGSSAVPPGQVAAPVQKGSAGKIMQKNQGKAQAPTNLGAMTTRISDASAGLQGEANAYMSGVVKPFEKTNEEINSSVANFAQTGDQGLMNAYSQRPQALQGIKLNTDTNVRDVDLLKNDSGIKELFRRRGDAEYSQGEAALDSALLKGDQGFQLERDGVLNSYKAMLEEKSRIGGAGFREEAQAAQGGAYDTWRGRTGEALQGYVDNLQSVNEGEERAFDGRLLAAEEARRSGSFDDVQRFLDDMASNGNHSPGVAKAIRQALGGGTLDQTGLLNPNDFYVPGRGVDRTSADDFFDDGEALQFNNIMSLLGTPGQSAKIGGKLSGTNAADFLGGGLDTAGLSSAALGYATPRAAAEKAINDQAAADKKLRDDDNAAAADNKVRYETEKTLETNLKTIYGARKARLSKDQMTSEQRAAYDALPFDERQKYDREVKITTKNNGQRKDTYWGPRVDKAKSWFGG